MENATFTLLYLISLFDLDCFSRLPILRPLTVSALHLWYCIFYVVSRWEIWIWCENFYYWWPKKPIFCNTKCLFCFFAVYFGSGSVWEVKNYDCWFCLLVDFFQLGSFSNGSDFVRILTHRLEQIYKIANHTIRQPLKTTGQIYH